MSVRAKFRVGQVSDVRMSVYTGLDANGRGVYQERDCKNIKLWPVTTDTEENKAFFASTPGGIIELNVVNPEAADQLELGKTFYIDFTEAENA